MPLLPIFGHTQLRERIVQSLDRNSLPQSLLLHGPARIGKQRLALWIAQTILCDSTDRPCGRCPQCSKVLALNHKDLLWVFPQMRLKDSDVSPDDAAEYLAQAGVERAAKMGLYETPSGMEGIHIPAIRAAIKHASLTPALARRKAIVIGDAERMASQEGSEQAANAFLKLLEEPPSDTYVIITSSNPGKLLPTIRSRVAAVRVAPVGDEAVTAWYEQVSQQRDDKALKGISLPESAADAVRVANGAIGRILDTHSRAASVRMAQRLIEVAQSGDSRNAASLALAQGSAGARGSFSETLDALADELIERMRAAVETNDQRTARGAAAAVELVEDARVRAYGNNNPQLITSRLLTEMSELLGRG